MRGAEPPKIAGCEIFPPDNIWNAPIDDLPGSEAYVRTIGYERPLHPDFGAGTWRGFEVGIPYTIVGGNQAKTPVLFASPESDAGPYPVPRDARIEGGPLAKGDRHVLVLDHDECMLYELFGAWPQADGSWKASSGAVFDLKKNGLRTRGWTSADAAGLPILPGLVRYDEVAAGEIRHAIRMTAPLTQRKYMWPARHRASKYTDADYPPMGQRFRLRADFDLSGFSPGNRVILRALKEYGMLLADNGGPWYISGTPDDRWSKIPLDELKKVRGKDFEAVDVTPLMVDEDSAQVRNPEP